MVTKILAGKKDALLRGGQRLSLLLSCLVVAVFLRFHLLNSAADFRASFERQNFIDLSRGETFSLARKLAALAKDNQFACISAHRGGLVFFEEKNSRCELPFLRAREIVREPNRDIEIAFDLQLQSSLFWGFLAFLLTQSALASTIFLWQRRLHFLQHQYELELAALAEQVSHDIQSPLAILRSLDLDHFTPVQKRLQKRALLRLQALLGFLHQRPGDLPSESTVAQLLSASIEEKLAECRERERPPAIALEWQNPLGPLLLPGSGLEWKSVFSNLLNNAIEASPERAAEISVVVAAEGAHSWAISFCDRGPGIARVLGGKLGSKGISHGKPQGRGLGLYQTIHLVERASGRFTLTNREGGGAEARILLPLRELQAKAVVLVDDDAELAEAWRAVAEKRGWRFQHFFSLEELLAVSAGLPKNTPIYLDWNLPGSSLTTNAVGQRLRNEGYQELYLASGRSLKAGSVPAWAKAAVGKEPPWL